MEGSTKERVIASSQSQLNEKYKDISE